MLSVHIHAHLALFSKGQQIAVPYGIGILKPFQLTNGFVGMDRKEAWPLIEELAAHATQDRLVYYHSWQVGDLLIWDERATMHRGAGDYAPQERRVMLRTIVYPS